MSSITDDCRVGISSADMTDGGHVGKSKYNRW